MRCLTPIHILVKAPNVYTGSKVREVPCGKCANCLKNRRISWIIRLKEELKKHESTVFVTLTYEKEPLEGVNVEDIQKFLKKLRHKSKLRYYGVGEYGTRTFRAHYHLLIFGCSVEDTDNIRQCWSNGHVVVKRVNERRVWYTTKYHVNRGCYPENKNKSFTFMSRNPGIGNSYIERMSDWHKESDERIFYQDFQFKSPLPRYYKEKIYSKSVMSKNAQKYYMEAWMEEIERESKNPKEYFKERHDAIINEKRILKQKVNYNETI